jgi:hypothetical protein
MNSRKFPKKISLNWCEIHRGFIAVCFDEGVAGTGVGAQFTPSLRPSPPLYLVNASTDTR